MTLAIDITDGCGLSNEGMSRVSVEEEQGNAVFVILFAVNAV